MKDSRMRNLRLLWTVIVTLSLSACTFYKPKMEVPTPDDNDSIEKTFFLGDSFADGTEVSKKTFLCGWAPVSENGRYAEGWLIHMAHQSDHCNLRWQVTEHALVAKRINPSYPDNPDKWVNMVTIPIEKHYYLEAPKDSRGRDRNELVEVSNRSHWARRPYLRLNLKGMSVKNWMNDFLWGEGSKIVDVYDVEWDKKRGFLGFTVYAQAERFGEELQGRFRVNFLEFKHDPNFSKTPMTPEIQKYMNILHVMGKKSDGLYQILHAAHWDLSKTNDVHLSNVPPKYKPIIENVVEKWNQAFEDIGAVPKGHKAFRPVEKTLKYPFDLRYPSIHWVQDQEISSRSPLGIGQAHADVRNGQILWGGILLYGGMLERYINGYLKPSAPDARQVRAMVPSNLLGFENQSVVFPKGFEFSSNVMSNFSGTTLIEDYKSFLQQEISELSRPPSALASGGDSNLLSHYQTQLDKLNSGEALSLRRVEKISGDLNSLLAQFNQSIQNQISGKSLDDFLPFPDFKKIFNVDTEDHLGRPFEAPKYNKDIKRANNVFGAERTFEVMAPQWAIQSERSEGQGTANFADAIEAVITDLTMHEYGHFLGLGHQFKGNLLPKKGTIPPKMYESMAALATEEAGFQHFTSIMDYRHGTTEVNADAEKIGPGEHDKLVLRYLYNQEYPGYITDSNADDFTYFKLPSDGMIPEYTCKNGEVKSARPYNQNSGAKVFKGTPCQDSTNEAFKVSYFQSCNDTEASFYYDPMCNRWDRGASAKEISENYWKDLTDNLVQRLFAFTDNTADSQLVEYYLWYRSISTMARIRLFYDYMRRKFEPQIDRIRKDENLLFQFSSACSKESPEEITNPTLKEIFSKNPEFHELCRTNKDNISEFNKILTKPLVDYTRIDHDNYFLPGGLRAGDYNRDYNKWIGTWKQMTNLPLKVSAAFSLFSPKIITPFGSAFYYDHPDANYFYGSLYPREYTETLGSAVTSNLRFQSLGDEATYVGKTITWLGYLQFLAGQTNDNFRFPLRYMENIYEQTNFSPQVAVVIVEGVDSGEPEKFKRFKLIVYDIVSRKEIPGEDAYILPEGEVIARANNIILYPMTPLKFFSDSQAYAFAMSVNVNRREDDPLAELGAKEKLLSKYNDVLNSCIEGDKGLNQYFTTTPEFEGFYIPKGIARNEELEEEFKRSVREEFAKFKSKTGVSSELCFEAKKGIAASIAAAGVMQGYWYLPKVFRVDVSE